MKKIYNSASYAPDAIEAARQRGREEMALAKSTINADSTHRRTSGLEPTKAEKVAAENKSTLSHAPTKARETALKHRAAWGF